METVRVDISYRPLRIGYAIKAGDMEAFRASAQASFALWGGRFNPIIVVDQLEQAEELINVFRVDLILPVGDSEQVKQFPNKFPHLITPFFPDSVLVGGEDGARSQVLDIYNGLIYAEDKPEWKAIKELGLRLYTWTLGDPLADVFLIQFGEYPSADEIHIDYRGLLKDATMRRKLRSIPHRTFRPICLSIRLSPPSRGMDSNATTVCEWDGIRLGSFRVMRAISMT